ncbi:MAG: site-2 protease family protein [Nitrososphaeria archaeon]|nr:site-2 protease family protein [Nitrososphaeria archaeon]
MIEFLLHPLVVFAVIWIIAYLIFRFVFRRGLRGVKLYPLGFVLKTERTVVLFDKIASTAPSILKVLSDMGVALGFGMMAFSIYILSKNLGVYLFTPTQVGPQNIVIPLVIGVTIRLEHLPYILFALGIVLITHEGMHGLIARLEKIRIKSTGLFLFYLFPGGFVEPDEEEFRKASSRARARVAAGGSLANLVVGLLVVLLMFGIFSTAEAGVVVIEVDEGSGIKVNDVVYSVNGVPVNRNTLFENISATDLLTIQTSRGNFTYRLGESINVPLAWILGEIGIRRVDYYFPMKLDIGSLVAEYTLYRILSWTQLIAINVAIFNMMPIYFLDGSLLLSALLEPRIRCEKAMKLLNTSLTAICLLLLAANIGFTFKTFGFLQI